MGTRFLKHIDENWDFYIQYSKETYPEEYKDKEFDITQKKWLTKTEIEERNNKRKTKAQIKAELKAKKKAEKEIKIKKNKRKLKITPRALKIKEFHKIRHIILDRDSYKCVECGSDCNVEVHHIKPISKGGNNEFTNLITLCHNCHTEKHKDEPVYKIMVLRFKNK